MAKKRIARRIAGNPHVLAVALIVAILVAGLLTVQQSFQRLDTYTQLNELRLQQDRELSEYTRLLIEKESLSSFAHVQRESQSDGLIYPDQLVKPLAETQP